MEVRHSVQERQPRFNLQKFAQSIIVPEGFTLEAVGLKESDNPSAVRLRLSTALMSGDKDIIDVYFVWQKGAGEAVIQFIWEVPSLIAPDETEDEGYSLRLCAGVVNNEWEGPTKISIANDGSALWVQFSITLALPLSILRSATDYSFLSKLIGYNAALLLVESKELYDRIRLALERLCRGTIH